MRCTFEDAERNHLLDGIRMSTRGKIELFEEMLDFAWKTGAIKRPQGGYGVTKQTTRGHKDAFKALMEAVEIHSLGQISHALYEVGGENRTSS